MNMSSKHGCIYVELSSNPSLVDLCEEVYRVFLSFLNKGLRRVRLYVRASKASDWVRVSSCILTRNLIATVEVYTVEELDRNTAVSECAEIVEVPVAPPTSLIRERRQVIP
ncbi:MAG: hypothetical protein QW154_06195 [Sulfolobales archaeon]